MAYPFDPHQLHDIGLGAVARTSKGLRGKV